MLAVIFYALSSLSVALAGADGWHMDNAYFLVNEAIDPIVNVNAQGSHMHKVVGGSGFGASYDFNTYAKARCSSIRYQADKSNYWMPGMPRSIRLDRS